MTKTLTLGWNRWCPTWNRLDFLWSEAVFRVKNNIYPFWPRLCSSLWPLKTDIFIKIEWLLINFFQDTSAECCSTPFWACVKSDLEGEAIQKLSAEVRTASEIHSHDLPLRLRDAIRLLSIKKLKHLATLIYTRTVKTLELYMGN